MICGSVSFACSLQLTIAFAVVRAEKKSKDDTKKPVSKGKTPEGAKSPRVDSSADEVPAVHAVPGEEESLMTFQVGDTKLSLTHKKLLSDVTFHDM